MHVRIHLIIVISSVVGTIIGQTRAREYQSSQSCRCFPGDSCWPTKVSWEQLNKTVGGRLIATIPLGTPCHGDEYDESRCREIRDTWNLPDTHIATSSSIMAKFFANQSCEPFLPRQARCIVGTYVRYAVDARSVSDYQATIAFARVHNIRLVIRNTGHDYFGKSSGSGSLAIWTHNFKSIKVLDLETSEYSGKALKVSAGTQLQEAYQAAYNNGLVVVGGTSPSVGYAGGYAQGGGHGYLASRYGFGADQVLEWEVVTANGTYLTASPSRNKDLYWALSGGGGGSYAVVVSMTVKAYPEQITAASNLTWTSEGISQDIFYAGINAYLSRLPSILDAGATTTWLNSNESFAVQPAVGFGMSSEKLDSLHKPILEALDQLNISYTYTSSEFPSFFEMYLEIVPFTEAGVFQIGSRLIPREVILNSTKELTAAMREIGTYGAMISGLSFNATRGPNVSNSISPAFRKASVSLVIGTPYNNTDRNANIANQELMTNTLVPQLSDLIPGGGSAYLNEGDPWESNWQRVFYGEVYERLLEIKRIYDPEFMLYGRTAVGSEAWIEMDDGRLCQIDMLSKSIYHSV
ncbi:putative alcohol oxidase [Hypoxylon crocopeplum]|nr:putative alcohol oxidase [Hypoxylon crocopeplum]